MIQINMEMPKTCEECDFEIYNGSTDECLFVYNGYTDKIRTFKRLDGCPLHEVTEDPDTVSRQQAIDAVKFGITHAKAINKETGEVVELFKASNDELRKAVDRIKALPPSPSRPSEQPEQERDKCDDCNFTGNCTSWDKIEQILNGGICPRDKAGIRKGVRHD